MRDGLLSDTIIDTAHNFKHVPFSGKMRGGDGWGKAGLGGEL